MKTFIRLVAVVIFLAAFHAASAQTEFEWPEAFHKKLDWKFSEEDFRLFSPPLDATIEQMRMWADQLERQYPEDLEKWGGFEKYRERVARLQIDIARQILASKPEDDLVMIFAWSDQWFPHYILAQQDKTNIPAFENFYAELKRQNDEHGRKLDRFTDDIMSTRYAVVRDLLELQFDKKYLALGDELLAEYDALLEGKPLGEFAEGFYGDKECLLNNLAKLDEKYKPVVTAFRKEMRNLLIERENELETASLYFSFGPDEPFDTPEGQAVQQTWMERIATRIAVTENAENRCNLYRVKGNILYNLYKNNAVTDEEYLAYAKELEAQTGKDIHHSSYMNDIYNIHFWLFSREFDHLLKSDEITDDALGHLFTSANQMLHAGESAYGHGGQAFYKFIYHGDELLDRCTPRQQAFYFEAFEELLQETEKVEKEWIAAGKRMDSPTELPPLREHLARRQLSGKEISLVSTTLDGEPFDLESLRGKIVLLDFWATWCGPCVAEIPELQKRYEEFHARGFEIVGISIDMEEDKEKLAEFIQSRQLPWIQLHDPKNELFRKVYGRGVPYCLLLDREGKVILQSARGEILKKKLEEIFQ